MTISTSHVLSCNDCKNAKIADIGKTRAGIFQKAKKEGWLWKSAEIQYCPKCKDKHIKVAKKVAKPAPVKAVKKAVAKVSKPAPKATKPAPAVPAMTPTKDGNNATGDW